MVTLSELKEKCRKFEERERRAIFYKLASEIKDDHPLQAAVIILATWNAGRFRLAGKKEIIKLKEASPANHYLTSLKTRSLGHQILTS